MKQSIKIGLLCALELALLCAGCGANGGSSVPASAPAQSAPEAPSVSASGAPEAPSAPASDSMAEAPAIPTELAGAVTPDYYEEQALLPTFDTVVTGTIETYIAGRTATGPDENGAYLELTYSYNVMTEDEALAKQAMVLYAGYLTQQGFDVTEVSDPSEYLAVGQENFKGSDSAAELYHIAKDGQMLAAVSWTVREDGSFLVGVHHLAANQ